MYGVLVKIGNATFWMFIKNVLPASTIYGILVKTGNTTFWMLILKNVSPAITFSFWMLIKMCYRRQQLVDANQNW